MPIVLIGISHHSSPVSVRERFALSDAAIPPALKRLRSSGLVDEAVILSTCNRVELYAATPFEDPETMARLQGTLFNSDPTTSELVEGFYRLAEPRSIEHLFKVASGLDSMVLGETEILGQLKKAYQLALEDRQTGALLNRTFQKAFNVAKHIRTETNIQRGSVSVGSVAVELAEKIFSSLDERDVMVIGAGDTSEKTARALLSRGARSIFVSNRSHERAVALAQELGGQAIHFEEWAAAFPRIDIIVSGTASPHYILNRARLETLMRERDNRPLLLIDIAVPRDIDPQVNFLDNVYLYNIDDLQAIADDYLEQRRQEIARCETIIRDKAASLFGPPGSRLFGPRRVPPSATSHGSPLSSYPT